MRPAAEGNHRPGRAGGRARARGRPGDLFDPTSLSSLLIRSTGRPSSDCLNLSSRGERLNGMIQLSLDAKKFCNRTSTERDVLSVARFCHAFPCQLRGPAWAVGSYSISQSAGGTSQNITFKTLRQIDSPALYLYCTTLYPHGYKLAGFLLWKRRIGLPYHLQHSPMNS